MSRNKALKGLFLIKNEIDLHIKEAISTFAIRILREDESRNTSKEL